MKVSVLGIGEMGSAIARALSRTSNDVFLRGSSEGNAKCLNLAKELNAHEAKLSDLLSSDVIFAVVNADKINAISELLKGYSGTLVSVIGKMTYLKDNDVISNAEKLADMVPTAKVVHGLLNLASVRVLEPSKAHKTSVFICGDDSTSVNLAANVIQQMGLHPVKAGKLINARYAEATGLLWGAVAIEAGYGYGTYFEIHPDNERTFEA